ncbi:MULTISPECIES: YpoC family protein [unclassified Solibacillus]|uniref:YpoC family protein n=1 Tax=unclassified Solibacillus TaxID=2637870 RepID=UPI0030F64719
MILVNTEAISKEIVDRWYEEWEAIREDIHNAHERRDGSAIQFMQKGIELFEGFLMTSSITENTVFSQQNVYELMPINGMERLQFVKMRPGQYACYRQLDELFKETKKRCARLRLKK